ncbi:hypothetical protein C9J27_05475 [Photobacterium kishitanii]|uniref:Uncharacterized protein n=2 Tax=Photobacterium kishitanii TaxID=318456 RepID=A0A2T3KLN3_9GAMM|nr:hypothetical protein C9J27_05475 [Photobacterium kishitanii]
MASDSSWGVFVSKDTFNEIIDSQIDFNNRYNVKNKENLNEILKKKKELGFEKWKAVVNQQPSMDIEAAKAWSKSGQIKK